MKKTTLSALRKSLDEKQISAKELCGECFKAIEKDEEKIGAFITLAKEEAEKTAEKAQERIDKGNAAFLTG